MLSTDALHLENAYRVFNEHYFDNALPPVVLTIQSSRGAYGHCTVQKVWSDGQGRYYELNLGAEYLNRPIENVLATLMHEMVHIFCLENGLKDTSNGNRYHNGTFKKEAEKRGLSISYAQRIGWSVTAPTPAFVSNIHDWGLDVPLENYRAGAMADPSGTAAGPGTGAAGGGGDGSQGRTKKPTSTRKYQCPVCGNSVRATKDVNILCMDCNTPMLKIEK